MPSPFNWYKLFKCSFSAVIDWLWCFLFYIRFFPPVFMLSMSSVLLLSIRDQMCTSRWAFRVWLPSSHPMTFVSPLSRKLLVVSGSPTSVGSTEADALFMYGRSIGSAKRGGII